MQEVWDWELRVWRRHGLLNVVHTFHWVFDWLLRSTFSITF